MFGIFSFLSSNKLFINRIARSVLQNLGLSISRYGPYIRLINSNYKIVMAWNAHTMTVAFHFPCVLFRMQFSFHDNFVSFLYQSRVNARHHYDIFISFSSRTFIIKMGSEVDNLTSLQLKNIRFCTFWFVVCIVYALTGSVKPQRTITLKMMDQERSDFFKFLP